MQFLKKIGGMAIFTNLSRVFGFIRTLILAYVFGTGPVADAFLIAFKLPNLMRRLFAEGAMSGGFIPLFTEITNAREQQQFLRTILGWFLLIVGLFCAAGIFFSKNIIDFYYLLSVKDSGTPELAAVLLKIMFPYLFLVSFAAIAQGVLNSLNSFRIPAFTAVLFNIIIISFFGVFVLLRPEASVKEKALVLAMGVTAGGLGQLLFQLPFVIRAGYLFFPGLPRVTARARQFFILIVPVLFSAGIYPINNIINDIMVLSLEEGAVASLYYSLRIQELPLGIIVVSIATVCLPLFSRYRAQKRADLIELYLGKTWLMLVLLLVPVIFLSILLRREIFLLLFYGGRFTVESAAVTARCFVFHGLAAFFIGVSRIKTALFFAFKDTRTPFKITLTVFTINITSVFLFTRVFKYPVHMVAAASLISAAAGALCYTLLFFIKTGYRLPAGFSKDIIRAAGILTAVFLLAFFLQRYLRLDFIGHLLSGRESSWFISNGFAVFLREQIVMAKTALGLKVLFVSFLFFAVYYFLLRRSGLLTKIM